MNGMEHLIPVSALDTRRSGWLAVSRPVSVGRCHSWQQEARAAPMLPCGVHSEAAFKHSPTQCISLLPMIHSLFVPSDHQSGPRPRACSTGSWCSDWTGIAPGNVRVLCCDSAADWAGIAPGWLTARVCAVHLF